jgi:4-diphosphocytidyl-2-C-methyl-D-erythritol kinase
MTKLWRAPAKVNLSLHVLGRRADGYHELDSLVAFAGVCDWLAFAPEEDLSLTVFGPEADASGPDVDNLVLKAARAFARELPGARVGRFRLNKLLPVAAGLGGGSSDAAAALRALAELNGLAPDDDRLRAAAESTGADVPVCLDPRARVMSGIGHGLGPRVDLPPLPALLVNPRVATPTPRIFAALGLERGHQARFGPAFDLSRGLAAARNDLQAAAIEVAPVISEVLERLAALDGARLSRMSGSGATCFATFDDRGALSRGLRAIRSSRPGWWARATYLR